MTPGDTAAFLTTAKRLRNDPAQCSAAGARGRAYAESTFDIRMITDRFEKVLAQVAGEFA